MTTNALKTFLLWCLAIDYGLLLVWLGAFVYAHDWMYRLHTRWFKLPVETFDAIHYGGMAAFKIGVMLLGLAPLIALHFST